MRIRPVVTVALAACLAAPGVPLAHHSTSAEYDRSQTVEFIAVLDRTLFINPHVWFYAYETLPDGTIKEWQLQWGSPGQIQRAAVQQFGSVDWEIGKTYTFKASPHRSDAAGAYIKSVLLPDGNIFFCC